MVNPSSSFRRGMVTGILAWAAVVGLGRLLADVPSYIPATFESIAVVNLVVGSAGAALVYYRERRARRLDTA